MLLQGRDRHDPFVGVVQMASGLGGLHFARALQQHAGNDLKAVGDAVLKLLKKNRLLLQHVVGELLGDARVGDIRDRDEEPDAFAVAVIELLRIEDQAAGFAAFAVEVDLIAVDRGIARCRRFQQRDQLRHIPLARTELAKRKTRHLGRIDLKRIAEGPARDNQGEVAVEKKQRCRRRGDHRQREIENHIRMRSLLGSHGCPFLEIGGSRSESRTRINLFEIDKTLPERNCPSSVQL